MSETTQGVETMEAGPAMNAFVAELVMNLGRIECNYPCGYHPDGCELEAPDTRQEADIWDTERHPIYRIHHKNGWNQPVVVPFYSTEIAAAWGVVERLRSLGWDIGIEDFRSRTGAADCWRVDLHRDDTGAVEDAFAETVPLAICKAALQAVAGTTPTR